MTWHVQTFASVESTQDFLADLLQTEDILEGTVIQALEQKKGKGRQGNGWVSPMGNLYMSFLLRPSCDQKTASQLSFVIALAIARAISAVLQDETVDVQLKWPNDVMIDGQKCAGILLQSHTDKDNNLDAVIVGTGINILSAPDQGACTYLNAYDCAMEDRRPLAIHPFRDVVLDAVSHYYGIWRKDGFQPIRQAWLDKAYNKGGAGKARTKKATEEGTFIDINEDGALLLEQADGKVIAIHSADVYF